MPLPEANGYYSTEDEQRMQAMVRALLQGRRPIALSSPSNEALDHYSRLLVRDLRQHDHVRVVAHLPGSCDKLVQQVNDLLADLPLSHVVARDGGDLRPIHVFVVHDSPTLSNAEFALLTRLVNDLPGANLRIALIQDRDFAVTGNLQALGGQALHWRIQVAGMPASSSSEASRAALREALHESPEALPAWARAEQAPPPLRRWRLAFWRRDEARAGAMPRPHPGKRQTPARAGSMAPGATAKPLAKPLARAASKPLAKAASVASKSLASRPGYKPGYKPGHRPVPAPAVNSVARRNRVILVSGLFVSAALAAALGTWLSIQPGANRATPPARAAALPAVPTTTTAAVTLRPQP